MDDEYHFSARYYDLLLSRALRPVRDSIKCFINEKNCSKILDLCCGTGEQLQILQAENRQLTGIDMSAAMIKQARKKSSAIITYHQQDATELQITAKKFDCIIISFAMHEKQETTHQAIWDKGWKLLQPGSYFIVADYCHNSYQQGGRLMGSCLIPLVERIAGATHFRNYKNWMYRGALQGFLDRQTGCAEIIRCHFHNNIMVCAVRKPSQGS